MFRKCLNLSSAQTHIPSRCISRTSDLFQVKNHYDVLGLTPKATQNDIKAAYYKLSMLYHPDKNKGSDEVVVKKFRDITAAYEVLGTYRLRKLYDKGILQPSAGPVPPPEPEFKSPTDVQPDDDAQTKFYKSRFKRSEVPDGSPIYDFDTWAREHYGSTLNRSQKAKAKYEKIVSDTGQSKGYSHVEILLFGGLVLVVLVVYVNYEESLNDMVKSNDKGAPGAPKRAEK